LVLRASVDILIASVCGAERVNLPEVPGTNPPATDPLIAADEARKSNLLLEAQILRAGRRTDEAAVRFAQAARIEQRLAEACRTRGLRTESWMHRFGAAGCWAQAGNFHEAITLGEKLLAEADLPPRLRQRVEEYTAALRRRREQWSEGLASIAAGGE
jgi:hypothetical protein